MAEDFSDKEKIQTLYQKLLKRHGQPNISGQWRLWCKRPKNLEEKERIIIESILTQRANWKNVEIAVSNLKKADLLSLEKILQTSVEKIENIIRPSGFYKQKAKRLKSLAKFFIQDIGGMKKATVIDTQKLRKMLLEINGVGNETADDILLYALEMPIFVIDQYTKRFVEKHLPVKNYSYNFLQQLFENAIKKDYKIYQDYHALIVIEMKDKK